MSTSASRDEFPDTVSELHDVSLVFWPGQAKEVRALQSVNLEVRRQEVVGVLGPSGAGKTCLLEVVAGLRTATSGSVRLLGDTMVIHSRLAARQRAKHVRFVFQADNLIPYLTVEENLHLMSRIAGTPALTKTQTAALLGDLGIARTAMAELPSRLSGGHQQRVAIARASVGEPALILADEPTARLDRRSAESALKLLRDTAIRCRSGVLLVSHDEKLLDMVSSRIVHLEDGMLTPGSP